MKLGRWLRRSSRLRAQVAARERPTCGPSVLRHYQVKVRRSGKDQYRGCCPIHRGDGRGAFHVNVPMLGLKSFRTAAVVIAGVELAEKIKQGQFEIGKLGGTTATMPEIWRAVLTA